MTEGHLAERLGSTLERTDVDLGGLDGVALERGKVRDVYSAGDMLLIVTTDRLSAFDVVLTTIPCKGEILNRTSLFWFDRTADIMPNHILERVSPRTVLARRCRTLPVEIVVRGYLTGSAWRDYQSGRAVSGIGLPAGMRFNQRFEEPLLTPSTKAERGHHDEPISPSEIVSGGLVEKRTWDEIEEKARALYERGCRIAAEAGLILVDTKYEIGMGPSGALYLIDEVHTPDSSRYWYADTYEELFERGEKQRKLDKEYLRQWLMDTHGYMGNGPAPRIPDEVRLEVARRYATAYEVITGESFEPQAGDGREESRRVEEKLL